MKPLFMVRYGEEKQHLLDIVNGKLRFSPSQLHIEIEKSQNNKGQGDLLEGRMKIKLNKGHMQAHETGEVIHFPSNTFIYISIQDVNNMPMFCLSQYDINDTSSYVSDTDYLISIDKEKFDCIKKDFPKAKYALVIFEPERFISDVQKIAKHDIYCDEIRYYDYDIQPLQMMLFLTTGSEDTTSLEEPLVLDMKYENRHRHLYCKDIYFEKQQEYRFVMIDEKIATPCCYDFTFTSRYIIISLEELEAGIATKI